MFDVLLGRFRGVMRSVMEVALSRVGVVRRGLVIAGFVMFGGLAMMSSGVLVVLGCLGMMFCCLLGHVSSFGRGSWAGRA